MPILPTQGNLFILFTLAKQLTNELKWRVEESHSDGEDLEGQELNAYDELVKFLNLLEE